MTGSYKTYATFVSIALTILFVLFQPTKGKSSLPLIAIANYGPHSSLQQTIDGIKAELSLLGYQEGKNINYEIADVNFDTSLIMQMLSKLKSSKPAIIVTLSTPVTQAAKNMIKDIPIVYANVTDPVDAGLVSDSPDSNMTGASDKQDLGLMLDFAKQLLPNATRVGVLYSTGEANDLSLINMLKESAGKRGIEVVAVAVEHTRDAVTRMRLFQDKVDFIYTGSSGAIQASLPAIVSIAESMKLPLFNFNGEEVLAHNALASYGVSDKQVGANAARIIYKTLHGEKASNIKPVYPNANDHAGFISRKRAAKINLIIPDDLPNITIVD